MNEITGFTMTGKDGMAIQVKRIEFHWNILQKMSGDYQEQVVRPWHPLSAVPGNQTPGHGIPVRREKAVLASVIEEDHL